MPRKKWIDRNAPSTQTFQLLYRSQDDPLLHSEDAGDRALFAVGGKGQSATPSRQQAAQGLHLTDLEDDIDLDHMRENEGEAAEYGIYFDDTQYDYMQHLRDLGNGEGDSHFVDGAPVKIKGKGKAKTMKLEDILRGVSLDDDNESAQAPSLLDGGLSTVSRSTRQRTYQDQQDVPDEIAGFQPDMDPRLREVLEALDDDAYIDDANEEDVFGELGKTGKGEGEIDLSEFELNYFEGEDDGWESDVTEKALEQPRELKVLPTDSEDSHEDLRNDLSDVSTAAAAAAAAEDGDWLRDFAKYKRDTAAIKKVAPPAEGSVVSGLQGQAPSLYTLNGTPLRQKKRKGALTNPSAYSMTSSSLVRTDGQQLLDRRFDQIEKMYSLDEADELDDMDGGMSMISGMTGQSKMSQLSTASFADKDAVRGDFDGMMDDFLGGWNKANPGGKRKGAKGKRGKNGNEIFGLQQLDEVRAELGPARLYRKSQKA